MGIKKDPAVEGCYRVMMGAGIVPVCMEEKERSTGKIEFVILLD